MYFKSFHWLSHHGTWASKGCVTNMASERVPDFFVSFSLQSSFLYLGAFLIKQLFQSRLLDTR